MIALAPTKDFRLSIRGARDTPAGDLIAGQCLTVAAEVLASYPQDDPNSLGLMITSIVSNALQRFLIMQIEPFVHMLDGFLAYLIGVVKSMGTLILSQNMARCNPPDFFLQDVVHCACGDHALQIPAGQRQAGLAGSAHWCSGVLGMIDSNNQPYYVYNKYSYAELQAKSAGMASYTACVSTSARGYQCVPPGEPFFANQGVTTLNVLIKCRENYVKKRWDPAAHMLYQTRFWDLVHFQGVGVPELPATVRADVRACLTDGDASSGTLARSCLDEFLLNSGTPFDAYWAYERNNASTPEKTDGCLVFSGPADQGLPVFSACVDGSSSGGACSLPQHLWTPRSSNDVPLAAQHRVISHGVNRDGLVQSLYAQARETVLSAVEASLRVWASSTNPAVNAEFFSVEGDVLHQTMDCIFMGPYARMDYWPTPECVEGEECLRGPFWSRDAGDGSSRDVDPSTCDAPPSLPYTCGSPGRKSLMRYLVLKLLAGGGTETNQNTSNIGVILRTTLRDLAALWNDTAGYGCACAAGFSPLCCATNLTSPLLPERLDQKFTSVSAKTVLAALVDDMADLYRLALERREAWMLYMEDVSDNETQAYNWSGSLRATEEARLHPGRPASAYTTEPMSPLLEEDSTLWDVCHAALKQVFFTLPVDPDSETVVFDTTAEAFDGDSARLQEFVQRFTAEAFERSPLFRHYSPRHAPSESQMCAQAADEGLSGEGLVGYTAFVQGGANMLGGTDLPFDSPVYHPQRFRVGARGCLCGWRLAGQRCYPPSKRNTYNLVCQATGGCAADNSYALADEAAVVARFSAAWYCPEVELSPHWGYLDPSANEEWLALNRTTLSTSSRDLFRHGRAGLRPGNVQPERLPQLAKAYVNPARREVPLERGRLTTCKPPPPAMDLVQPFLDELFPANHGVDEAGAAAYCLRYAIELARQEVLRLLLAGWPVSAAVLQQDEAFLRVQDLYLVQRERAEVWRKRCGTQMHLLHLCASLRVFQPLLDGASRDPIACPHFRVDPATIGARAVYTTPQCLVSVDGVFYDPCRCVACTGSAGQLLRLESFLQLAGCGLRFDPRSMLREGVPMGWIDGRHPLPDPEAALLRETWAGDLLADPDAVGNVEGDAAWWQAEGPMAGNSEFCDTVLDWWPEEWDFPVGYHVTVPCEASETAYRSFAQAFGLDEEAGNTLVYQHDLLRDAALVDSHFGGAGLCRATTFGMPMPETNNMRYCTQMPLDDTEDFALPVSLGADPTDGALWTDWKCTLSSTQLPWPSTAAVQGAHQSSRYSVGTIPNMPPETSATYPASEGDMYEMGPVHEILAAGTSWGEDGSALCQDYAQRNCSDDAGCLLDAATQYRCRGRACTGDLAVACTGDGGCAGRGVCRGVCIEAVVQCIKHSDCADERMCSGLGTCEVPVLAVQNRLAEDNMTLSLAAHGDCGGSGRAFSLRQASYWGNTGKDVLRAHGMCSFEDWFKYTSAYSKPGCSRDAGDGTLLVDTAACAFVDLELPSTNQTKWWPAGNLRPEIMFVRPTICDRDYERLKNFTQCAPTAGTMLYSDGRLKGTALQFDQFVRLTDDARAVRLARMPEMNSTRIGFLGMAGSLGSLDELNQQPFVACGTIGQCYPAKFTLDGVVAPRAVPTGAGWANYSGKDAFTCGVFGVQTATGCALDPTRFPLYAHLCLTPGSCALADAETRGAISRACTSIPAAYQASYQDRAAVLDGLRALFYVFPQFQTLTQYLQITACVGELYASMDTAARTSGGLVSRGLYFPFMFALQELPFDWFYQCVVMSGLRIDAASHARQTCQAHATRADHLVDNYRSFSPAGDSFQTYLQYLRGGYLYADVAAYLSAQSGLATVALDAAIARLTLEMFRGPTDLSFPRCSSNLLWRIGRYGDAYKTDAFIPEARAIIWNRYDEQTCSLQWYEKLKGKLDAVGIPSATWTETLAEPDPLRLVPQDGAGATSLLKEAGKFMRAGLGLQTLALVTSQSTGCLRFNNQPPARYDHVASPLPPSLVPSPSVSAGTEVMDESVGRTCAFPPAFDPGFAELGTLACTRQERVVTPGIRTDHVQTCNGVECTTVPIYYKRNGKFDCRYAAEAVIGAHCTERSLGCEAGVMDTVYDALLRQYTANTSSLPPTLKPVTFPWFAGQPGFDGLDLSDVLDYMGNIQPNQERAIMCEITTSADEATRFTSCTNPHYLALQRHARAHYKHDGAVLVPAGAQLEWPLRRSLLARGVMLAYASTNRSIRKRFLDALFDDETVCKGEPAEHVCRRRANDTRFQAINPWTLGSFNPYEVCDVGFTSAGQGSREYISAFCLEQGNGLCPSFRSLSPAGCIDKNRRLVQQVGVPRAFNDYNLCHHANEEDDDGCMHDQGLLGGFDGLPVAAPADSSFNMIYGTKYAGRETYTVARNLYEDSEWSIPDDFTGGLFAGTNPLWQGDPAPYGYLRVDEDEIGGHRIGLAIVRVNGSDSFSTMRVDKLGLGLDEDQRFLDEAGVASLPTGEWVPGLQDAMAREDAAVRDLYGVGLDVRDLGASCPLQRWAFYSGGFAGFSPAIPAAKRARHLFHRVHGGLHAHPVMRTGAPGQFLGRYRSANGFCACPVLSDIPQVQCRVPVTDGSPCSLRTTIATLLAKDAASYTLSYVFPALNNEKATRRCEMMLDWPRVEGRLRDNSTVSGQWERASAPSEKACHILDRFRPFRYRYAPADALAPTLKNTVRDGACSTARVVSLPATATAGYARCLRVGLSGAAATFACNTTTDTFALPRRTRLGLPALLARRARRRTLCAQCAPPPAFRSQQGRPLPPESSFGRLHRMSPERLLAKDLRDALCPDAGPCPLLNASGWRAGEFMRNYMRHPERLFLNRTAPAPPAAKPAPAPDADWTGRPWVYCPTAGSLRTGVGCRGTLSRAAWSAGRATLCPEMVRSYSASILNNSDGDPMARTPFCSIDNTTILVCEAVAAARQLLIQANCIARGEEACMPSPFVYHPASYEPSNNAWVHDSVKAFYRHVDATKTACPAATQTDSQLVAFARAYQRSCPANGVNVFVGVLQAVRSVATDVSLLLTTMVSMAFNTLQLFVTTGREQARAQIGKNWAYIRSKARASLDAMGDVLVNALLNSGEAGARIMDFFRRTCDGLNRAAEWFLNVWCNYIQKYTMQFLAGMRKFLGITGAGFDILQDFMDEVFQGILPAAFISKYASGPFQNALIERYSQPSEKKRAAKADNSQQVRVTVNGRDVVGVASEIPDSANPREVSKTAEQKGFLSRVFGSAGRTVRGIAKAASMAAVGLGLFEIIQGIMSAAEEERLRALYPENFTLFDLTDIMNVVDDMEDFILSPLSQQTCASFQLMQKVAPDRGVFTCLKVDMDSYAGTTAGTTSIDATMCWANAVPSIGQNSMFACSGASTCCRTAECADFIMCASCAEPSLPGVSKYGCDSLRQKCVCSITAATHSRCAANRQCDAASECDLVSSLNSASYGTIPCGNCPNTARLMCLMPSTGMPARCACMLAGGPAFDLCNDRSGMRTLVDSSRLCGYLHNREAEAVSWAFDMDDLIVLPCAQVSAGVCSVVARGSALEPLRMVVAETVRFTNQRRRLLESEPEPAPEHFEGDFESSDPAALQEVLSAPGWDAAAAPCSTLALAHQRGEPLGLLETHVLHTCAFWRHVGRRVIARYQLGELLGAHDTLLLSMEDLVSAAMAPGVALALLKNAGLFATAALHHPWMRPVRALGVAVANHLEYLHWVRSVDADVHEALFGELTPEDEARQALARARARIEERARPPRRQPAAGQPAKKQGGGRRLLAVQDVLSYSAKKQGRRLLAVQDVLSYSARVIQNPSAAIGVLPSRVFGAWSTAEFAWPPRYNYSLEACPIAVSALDIGTHVALINKMYYANFAVAQPKATAKTLRGNLPNWAWVPAEAPPDDENAAGRSWASTAFRWALGLVGMQPAHLVAFFTSERQWSLTWVLVSLTQCDLASTLTCSGHDKDAFVSTIVFVLFYLIILTVTQVLGMGFLSTLFLLSYPWFILWYVYGMAPTCAPLLPTCLLADAISVAETLLPEQLVFPPNLACANNATACLRPCAELGFVYWADPLAFALCDADDGLCGYLHGLGPSGVALLDENLWNPAREAMARFQRVVAAGDLAGHRVCTWVSFVTVIPILALLLSASAILVAVVLAGLDVLPSLVMLVCQAVVFYET